MNSDGGGKDLLNQIAVYFLGAIMLLIAMVVFLVFIVMLVMRIVTLWVLTVVSPIMFLASAFPKTERYFTDWSEELMKNLFSGPTLAFFLWLTFFIVGSGQVSKGFVPDDEKAISASGIIKGEENVDIGDSAKPSNVVNYIVAISMLMLGLKMAQQSGAAGASFASNMAGKLKSVPGRLGKKVTDSEPFQKGKAAVTFPYRKIAQVPSLLYSGTSGQGMVKGGISRLGRGLGGKAVQKVGEGMSAYGIPIGGRVQRAGMRAQGLEQKRQRDKAEGTRKGGENVSDQEGYLATVGGKQGVDLRGRAKLDNNEEFGAKEAEEFKEVLKSAGDTASLRKLQAKVATANDEDSVTANINKNGVEATYRDMSWEGAIDSEKDEEGKEKLTKGGQDAMRTFFKQDPKARQATLDSMKKDKKDGFLAAAAVYDPDKDKALTEADREIWKKDEKGEEVKDKNGERVLRNDSVAGARRVFISTNSAVHGQKMIDDLTRDAKKDADGKDLPPEKQSGEQKEKSALAEAIAKEAAKEIDVKVLIKMDPTTKAFELLAKNLNQDLTAQFMSRATTNEAKQALVDAQMGAGKNTEYLVKNVAQEYLSEEKKAEAFKVKIETTDKGKGADADHSETKKKLTMQSLPMAKYIYNVYKEKPEDVKPEDRMALARFIVANLTAEQAESVSKPTLRSIREELRQVVAEEVKQGEKNGTSLLKSLADRGLALTKDEDTGASAAGSAGSSNSGSNWRSAGRAAGMNQGSRRR
jgi:hypothetical protein